MRRPNPPVVRLRHQEQGTQFLKQRTAAALFDEQGLGKTKQLIDAITEEVSDGRITGALIICPNGLKSTWADEIGRHSNARAAVFGSGRSARRQAFRSLKAVFYVINYEAVPAELPALRALLRLRPMALVLDESHRIKTPAARITRSILALRADAARRYIMTGTPIANKPDDIWSQVFFLDDGERLGTSFESFKARYGSPSSGYRRIEELRDQLASISLRREKEGTVNLPEKRFSRVKVVLEGQQREMYETLRTELELWVRALTGEEVLQQAENVLSRLLRLAQIASNPGLLDASYDEVPAKFKALDELLPLHKDESAGKVLVWTSFVPNISAVLARYEFLRPVAIHGEVDGKARDDAVRAFRQDPSVRLMVANPAAAREGLTLTEARTAIYLDRTFNLVDFLQSQDRIHRLSQKYPCDIILLLAENTVDEFVDFSLAQKHRLARYAQGDISEIAPADLAMQKPDVLRALTAPGTRQSNGHD